MPAIFENRRIEQNEVDTDKLKFPGDIIWTNIPLEYRNLRSGQSAGMKVKDYQDSLTIKKKGSDLWFTDWKKFAIWKDIKYGDKISLYEENNHFGPGDTQYRIEVVKKAS